MVKKVIKIVFIFFISLIALWFCCAWLLSKIKTNANTIKSQKDITIYVKSNGMHTDIVMPINIDVYDWDSFLDKTCFLDINETHQYIAIGWGDKGFYLNTPTMADLKAKTLTNALFGLGSTAMHVTYYKNLKCSDLIKQISISKEAYMNLVSHITQSFYLNNKGPKLIPHPNYGHHDNYFEAKGTYSIFKTCNV
ncbi:MAG: TIGR02117 family protein [Bacteroidetes bacterium]|nr:TIGR02117 family protein [Bacteroidota bacterium]